MHLINSIIGRFRYRLRTLFVLCGLVAIAAAWYGLELRAAQRQRAAVNAIVAKGGIVWYDRADHTTELEFIVHPRKGCGQTILLGDVRGNGVTFTEQDLPLVTHLRWLRMVDFSGSKVSAIAIENFRRTNPSCEVKP